MNEPIGWTDDCGGFAIHMLAYETMPYLYRAKKERVPNLYLVRCGDSTKYEWIIFDTQFTLDEFIETK